MDLHEVEQLLEKYWQCETSVEDEQKLRDFFAAGNTPASLKGASELFLFLIEEKGKALAGNFEGAVTKKIQTRQGGKVINMLSYGNMARIAAGIVVVVAATFLIRQEIRKSYPKELQDTYSDPQIAFEETKRALQMISNSFGKAKKEASKIQMLNEAERKIQTKPSKEKINL